MLPRVTRAVFLLRLKAFKRFHRAVALPKADGLLRGGRQLFVFQAGFLWTVPGAEGVFSYPAESVAMARL